MEEIPGFYPPVYTFGLKQDKSGGALEQAIAQVEFQAFYRPQYESQAQRILRVTRAPDREDARRRLRAGPAALVVPPAGDGRSTAWT